MWIFYRMQLVTKYIIKSSCDVEQVTEFRTEHKSVDALIMAALTAD